MQEADRKMLEKLLSILVAGAYNGRVYSDHLIKLAVCGFVYVTLQIIYENKGFM